MSQRIVALKYSWVKMKLTPFDRLPWKLKCILLCRNRGESFMRRQIINKHILPT
jgi:hypothetical protein